MNYQFILPSRASTPTVALTFDPFGIVNIINGIELANSLKVQDVFVLDTGKAVRAIIVDR